MAAPHKAAVRNKRRKLFEVILKLGGCHAADIKRGKAGRIENIAFRFSSAFFTGSAGLACTGFLTVFFIGADGFPQSNIRSL